MTAALPLDADSYPSLLEDNIFVEATLAESLAELRATLAQTKDALADTNDLLDDFLFGSLGLILIIVLLGIGILYLLHRQIRIIQHFKTKKCIHNEKLENIPISSRDDLHKQYRNIKDFGKISLQTINEDSHANDDLQSRQIFTFYDRNEKESRYNHLYEECNRSASYYAVTPSFRPSAQARTVESPVSSCSITVENVLPSVNKRKPKVDEHSSKKSIKLGNGSYQTFSIDTEESFYHIPIISNSDRSSKYIPTVDLIEKQSGDIKVEETKEIVVEPSSNDEEEETYDLPRPITEDKSKVDEQTPPPEHSYHSNNYENLTDFETCSRF